MHERSILDREGSKEIPINIEGEHLSSNHLRLRGVAVKLNLEFSLAISMRYAWFFLERYQGAGSSKAG
jgi:hypothetical protein